MNDFHSDDGKLYLRFQTDKGIFVDSGRISFVSSIDNFSLSDLTHSCFLMCSAPDVCIELLTHQELLSISDFLRIPIVKE